MKGNQVQVLQQAARHIWQAREALTAVKKDVAEAFVEDKRAGSTHSTVAGHIAYAWQGMPLEIAQLEIALREVEARINAVYEVEHEKFCDSLKS